MNPVEPKKHLIRGALWTVGTRWSIKALSFINTVIMARILVPEDYGIVAMSFLVIQLVRTLFDFGPTTALLREGAVDGAFIDSAWTLRLIQSTVIGLLAIAASPLAIEYFSEPRVAGVLLALGLGNILYGTCNIGPVLAQKEFNFALDFRLQLAQTVIRIVVTIGFGFLLGDYRALVIGLLASYIAGVVLSYTMHSYRPKWNLERIPEIWAVTKWLMLSSVGGFILGKGDELVAARIGTTAEYGEYNVGADLGQLPVGEVGPALLRPLLPVLASIKTDAERTRKAILKTVLTVNTVTWPIALGFFALAPQITELLLGPKWAGAAAFVGLFAVISALITTVNPVNTLLILHGHTKQHMQLVWTEFAFFACAAVLLVPHHHLLGLVYARMIGGIVNVTATLLMARRLCAFPVITTLVTLARPLAGAVITLFLAIETATLFTPLPAQLAISIFSGAAFYVIWSLVTWQLTRRPEGLESTVIDFLRARKIKTGGR